jgi:DNA-binding response OmpR family regulator
MTRTQTQPLKDFSVLVLEDDYYLADDARRTLEAAGAEVIGPFRDAGAAVAALDQSTPTCALVDINLGGGPDFGPARTLVARGVPIVFITGYDAEVIPPEFRHAPCLQKPVEGRKIVSAVGALCAG